MTTKESIKEEPHYPKQLRKDYFRYAYALMIEDLKVPIIDIKDWLPIVQLANEDRLKERGFIIEMDDDERENLTTQLNMDTSAPEHALDKEAVATMML